jgi:hypothetical protein
MYEAFVYCWTNLDNEKKYVGYHKGSQEDGYVCSSKSETFWRDWKNDEWSRQIIAEGTMEDCVALEFAILQEIELKNDEWYNNSAGGGIVFTEEVRKKMSRIPSVETRKKMSDAKKGKKISPEHARKLHEGRRNSKNSAAHTEAIKKSRLGHIPSLDTRQKMSETRLRNPDRFNQAVLAGKASQKARTLDPNFHQKHSKKMKKWWADRKAVQEIGG